MFLYQSVFYHGGRHECRVRKEMAKSDILRILSTDNTVLPQQTCDYIFYNNFNNKCPITIIFGTVSSQSMRHRKIVSFPTSPI